MREALGKYANLTRRWALRESLPPTEVTLQVYVPMSPDHVWEMCRVPSASRRKRGDVFTSITPPLFSHTCLKARTRDGERAHTHTHANFHTPQREAAVNSYSEHRGRWRQSEKAFTFTKASQSERSGSLVTRAEHQMLSADSFPRYLTHPHIWTPPPHPLHINMHAAMQISGAPLINSDYSGSPVNLLCVAFN